MIVVFGLEPRSVAIAYMLTRLKGAKAVLFDPEKQYFFDEIEDARRIDYGRIYEEYKEKFGELDFLEDHKLYEVFSADIFWSLRFRARDNVSLLFQVLNHIQTQGLKSYLSESTPETREMRFRVKRVLAEFNRALRFIRFINNPGLNLKIASASFDSDIADMVLRAEAGRSPPGYVIAVYDDKEVVILFNGEPFRARRQKIPLISERKDFKNFWSGLPESGRKVLVKDEEHSLKEMPSIIYPKEEEEKERSKESSSLDDFAT